ncbi:MAG: hypothetical protein IIB39_05100 [Candidatus Marinimicrobia bacterium]|nr:hypothetical protein [Candidatus Neomarinimicrobiota bacterium]
MKKAIKLNILTLLLLLVASNAYAGARGVFYNTMRERAMGNVGILSAKGATAFTNNPALLTRGKINFSLPTLQFFLNKNFVDLGNFISDNQEDFSNFDSLSPSKIDSIYTDLNSIDNRWMKLGVPVSAGITIKNIGLAFYATPNLEIKIDKGIYEPRVFGRGTFDKVVTFGFGKGLDFLLPGLKGGVGVKLITREEIPEVKFGFSEITSGGDAAEDLLEDSLRISRTGVAFDIGGLYKMSDGLELGFVLADVFGNLDNDSLSVVDTTSGSDFDTNLKIGARINLPFRIKAELMVVDLLNKQDTNFFNRVHIGAEMDLVILKLRGGFNQGYPTFGAGINLAIIQLDVAVWTDEIGSVPGLDGETFFGAQINLGF